jgi:hypothetical protein
LVAEADDEGAEACVLGGVLATDDLDVDAAAVLTTPVDAICCDPGSFPTSHPPKTATAAAPAIKAR